MKKNSFQISFAPLETTDFYNLLDEPSNGAIVIMSGNVRNQTDGHSVSYLEYQAYQPMALEVFRQIALEIENKWSSVNCLAIHHRIGKLSIGEISVLVGVACPHREESFSACKYAIDYLKHNAPIWKKEHWRDGNSQWISIGECEQENKNLG